MKTIGVTVVFGKMGYFSCEFKNIILCKWWNLAL